MCAKGEKMTTNEEIYTMIFNNSDYLDQFGRKEVFTAMNKAREDERMKIWVLFENWATIYSMECVADAREEFSDRLTKVKE